MVPRDVVTALRYAAHRGIRDATRRGGEQVYASPLISAAADRLTRTATIQDARGSVR